jgi:hypothetical protein
VVSVDAPGASARIVFRLERTSSTWADSVPRSGRRRRIESISRSIVRAPPASAIVR